MLANAKVNVAAGSVKLGEVTAGFHDSFVGRTKVSTAANQLRQLCSQNLDNITACFAGSVFNGILEDCFQSTQVNHGVAGNAVFQLFSQLWIYHLIVIHQSLPSSFICSTAIQLSSKMFFNLSRYIEHFLRPAGFFFGSRQCFTTQRLAMAGRAVLFRAAEADVSTYNNQRRMHSISLSFFDSCLHSVNILAAFYAQNLPAISPEAGFNILSEGNISAAFDSNFVVII